MIGACVVVVVVVVVVVGANVGNVPRASHLGFQCVSSMTAFRWKGDLWIILK